MMPALLGRMFELLLSPRHFGISIPALALILIGLLMVMSSSSEYSQAYHGVSFYFVLKQTALAAIGFVFLLAAAAINPDFWRKHAMMILLFNLLLLLLLFIPSIGKEVNASTRWLSLGGFNFQPSELLKLTLPLFYASYFGYMLGSRVDRKTPALFLPLGLILAAALLLLMQPDFGSVAIYTLFALSMVFFAGVKIWYLALAGFGAAAAALTLVAVQPYRLNRFSCLSDAQIWERFYQECYQVGQSLVAVERGSLWGSGLGGSIQKSFYLPEAYTDFVFAIMVEELGTLFAILLIGLFIFLLYNLLKLALAAAARADYFTAYFAAGVAVIWGLQFVLNLGVSLGYLPVTGLTLPFISYGGSSLVVNLIILGLLLRRAEDTYGAAASVRASEDPAPGSYRGGLI